MLKKGDKVLFSSCPAMKVPFKEYIVLSDERENENYGENTVTLEGFSGWVSASFCKKIEEEIELSDLEIKVLKRVKNTMRRDVIRDELALTHKGTARIFKKLKDSGFTKIVGYGGTFVDRSYEGEVDCYTSVGRYTMVTEKGSEFLLKLKD